MRIPFKLVIRHSPNLSIKGRVIATQSVVTPSLKDLIYRKSLKELGLGKGDLELRYMTSVLQQGLLASLSSLFFA